jgi:hypothetical protein
MMTEKVYEVTVVHDSYDQEVIALHRTLKGAREAAIAYAFEASEDYRPRWVSKAWMAIDCGSFGIVITPVPLGN